MKPRKPIKRRKPLRPRSKRMTNLMAEYRSARCEFLDMNDTCWRCDRYPSAHVHHTHGTVGRLRLAQEHWAALCEGCHRFIHDHPEIARAQGWLAPLGKWNKP